ncbi:MAG: formyltransferase family protein, partial [Pseudomonadota bacterium]
MTFGDYVLLCRTADRPGKLAAISDAVRSHGGDVRDAQSFGDDATGAFFVRMQVRLADSRADALRKNIAEIGDMLPGAACLHATAQRPRLVIAVSKFDHCLVDLLHRHRVGAIGGDIAAVISNHDTTRPLVEWHDIPFIHLPVTQETKFEQQAAFQRAVSDAGADLVVLARYMQVLSNELCDAWAGKCINIHHSFLPSFKG